MAEPKPDTYEAKYMGGAEALFRDRRGMPRWMHALFLLPLLLQLAIGVTLLALGIPSGLVNLAFVPLLAFMWMLFLFLRITVTKEALHVQYGVFGPKVPLERIEAVEVGTYDWVAHGGFGIRRSRARGGTAYSTPGGNGKCVTVTYRDDKGKPCVVTVTCDDAEELAGLLRAKGAPRVAEPGPRVAEARTVTDAELFAEAEAEAEAILAAERDATKH